MTKEHILKVISNNRREFAAHQLWKEFEAEQERNVNLEKSVLDLSHPNFKMVVDAARKPLVEALEWISSECGREAGLRADEALSALKGDVK
jgi:hypothetical protein